MEWPLSWMLRFLGTFAHLPRFCNSPCYPRCVRERANLLHKYLLTDFLNDSVYLSPMPEEAPSAIAISNVHEEIEHEGKPYRLVQSAAPQAQVPAETLLEW